MAENRKIALRVQDNANYDEGRADGSAILPGMALEVTGDDMKDLFDLAPNSVAGQNVAVRIATEDTLQGKTIDDAYADGSVVFYIFPQAGDILNLRLAASQTIVAGDKLVTDASGYFTKAAGTEDLVPFEAAESITTGAGATGMVRAVRL